MPSSFLRPTRKIERNQLHTFRIQETINAVYAGTIMKKRSLVLASLLISLVIWGLFSWPLPRYVFSGIPISHHGGNDMPPHAMHAGDHLQLEYYFWLFTDMLQGQTPWHYNLYEFNTGDDEDRYMPTEYYFPFSLFYGVGRLVGGRAFGYNFSAFLSIWLTYLFSWLLVRRYVNANLWAACAALFAILFPYRWFALLGGSPTGFAMTWVPLLMWGIDRAVRDGSFRGGAWAALAMLLSYTGDLHVFFFNALLIPAWCIISFVARFPLQWRNPKVYRQIAIGLLPLVVGTLAVILYSQRVASGLAETHMDQGREISEVITFSPHRAGLFARNEIPVASQAYIGYLFIILILLGFALTIYLAKKDSRSMLVPACISALLLAGTVMILILALGPHGPPGARFFHVARKWIPHYDMIRQSGKILSIFPPIGAVFLGICGASLLRFCKKPTVYVACCAIPIALLLYDYGRRNDPPISLMVREQQAYQAVAEDAQRQGIDPHVFVVTLWPGDSHFASVYQFYASLYRIRMINGYTPAIDRDYYENVYLPFQSINQGWMTDAQADVLLESGIEHLIVHADLFPEKVSPFPVAFTLFSLLDNPRLAQLEQDGPVWAFRILQDDRGKPASYNRADNLYFPTRHWLFERQPHNQGEVRADSSASRGHYLHLSGSGAYTQVGPTPTPPAHNLYWMFRARGRAIVQGHATANGDIVESIDLTIDSPEWQWFSISSPIDSYSDVMLELQIQEGQADFCSAFLAAGQPIADYVQQHTPIPAALFFHAGFLDAESGRVTFRQGIDRSGPVFYGPKLPLDTGTYELILNHVSGAATGTQIGLLEIEQLFTSHTFPSASVIGGESTRITFTLDENLPLNVIFHWAGDTDIEIESIVLKRIE